MSLAYVKIFGERNTATNALKALIEANCDARVLPSVSSAIDPAVEHRLRALQASSEGPDTLAFQQAREREIDRVFAGQPPSHAWKHCATRFASVASLRGALVLFCVRHPLSWLHALYRDPYHLLGQRSDSFARFLDHEWILTQRDNLPNAGLLPHRLYEAKLQSYRACMQHLDAAGIAWRVVRFEDLVLNQEGVLAALSAHLLRPASAFTPIVSSTKDKAKDLDYYRDYYGAERWRAEIAEDIPAITPRLAWTLFAEFGYAA